MITFIENGDRIAVENFVIGEIYSITFTDGNYKTMCCVGIGTDFVMFQDKLPNALFCLTLGTAETVSSIEIGGGGGGSMNYSELENKPQINGIILIGNKTTVDLGLVSQAELDNYVTDTELTTELADYATNASVVSALASKQDTLTTPQLTAVDSGITSSLVTQIGTNTTAIASKQDTLTTPQLTAVNSGITSSDVAQITTNKNNILYLADRGSKNISEKDTGTTTGAAFILTENVNLPKGDYIFSWKNSNTTSISTTINAYTGVPDDTRVVNVNAGNVASEARLITVPQDCIRIALYCTGANTMTDFMICTKEAWDISHDFQPYAPTNAELYEMIKALQS